jgi:RHS repeat-associated protein
MKTLRFLILGLLVTTWACQAQITDPGWFNAPPRTDSLAIPDSSGTTSISADSTSQMVLPTPVVTPAIHAFALMSAQSSPSSTNIAEAITPEIQALATGLQNNLGYIFTYVHDNIRYELYFGSKKGAQLTLKEKSGNDFDQCALLVALLRAAGYTNAAYQFGWMGIPYDNPDGSHRDLHHWLQLSLNNTNWNYTSNYLVNLFFANRGYPILQFLGDTNTFLFQRTWVTASDGTNNYRLDPAFKVSEPIPGLTNLAAAMNFSSNSLMTAAGGTDTSSSVTGLNEANLRSSLTGYTTNLLNTLKSNYPNYSVDQILSGQRIVPYAPSNYLFFATYNVGGMTNVTWQNEPTNLMTKLSITFAGTNCQLFMPQLQGQRLALTFDASGTAQLWQDDTLLAQHTTSGSSGLTNVVIGINHPFGTWNVTANTLIDGTFGDQIVTNAYQRTNSTYAIAYAFDPDWGWLQERQNMLDAYRQQGLSDTSRQVVSETLNIMGMNWMLQTEWTERMLALQFGVSHLYHHRFGRMAQESGRGYYVDIYMEVSADTSNTGADAANYAKESRNFDIGGYFESAFEHGVIEQLQNSNLVAASTVKMLQLANAGGQPIYMATSANWTSGANVKSSLINYPNLTTLTSFINSGYTLLLPQNGSNLVAGAGSWGGFACEAWKLTSTNQDQQMLINSSFHGGIVSDPTATADPAYVNQAGDSQSQSFTASPILTPAPTAADPVDVADGTFQVEHTDLSVGQSEPRGMTLSRYYNGTRRYSNPAGMADGWIHNYSVNAYNVAAPQAGLGMATPAQAAAMIAATCASIGIYNNAQPDPKNWMVTALIAKWGIDQLTRNGVSILLGKDTVQFVQQPNGVFTAPGGSTMTLAQSGSNYILQERHGNTFNFDSLGRLNTIVDQYGNTLSLTYSNNLVQTVTDWKGRSLTFTYTSSRLTSVADSTGRSVSYGYSGLGDLNSFTDPESKTSTYAYDTNHQITATFDALNQLVVSNIYDAVGHLGLQYSQGDTNKAWQIFWSGWENIEQNPAGGRRVFAYDNGGRLLDLQDQLGNVTQSIYDGQNHIVESVSPAGEVNQFVYDGNNNVIYSIDPLGFTNQFVFDSQNNLIRSVDARGNPSTFGYNTKFSLIGSTNGAGDFVNYTFNTDGTVASRTDSGGTTTYGYDSYGQLNTVTYPASLGSESFVNSALGDATSHTDARGNTTTFQYNHRRQPTITTAPTNLVTTLSYDVIGNLQTSTDARSNASTNFWSASRKLTKLTLPATPQGVPVLTNGYDNAGNQITLTNRNGKKWQFQYDGANRLTNTITPLGRSTSLAFNHQGLTASLKDPAGQTTTLSYDAKGRLSSRADSIGTTANSFDANDNITSISENSLTNTWTFDAYNRVTSCHDVYGNLIQYRYDASGNMTNLVYPGGKNVFYSFDSNNRMTNVTDWAGRKTSVAYDLDGRITSIIRPNGTQRLINYDAAGQSTNILEETAVGFPIALFKFNWNNAAEVQWEFSAPQHNTNSPGTRTMTYDDDNRLATFNGSAVTSDLDGNLTGAPLTNGTFVTYAYDARNRLINVGGVTNAYDAANNRIGQTYGTNTTAFVVNPNAKLPQVLMRIKNGVTNYYIYGVGLLYQVTETATVTNTLTYHYDFRGSTVALTDDNGNVTDRIEYSAYGSLTYRIGNTDTPFLFNGRYGVQTDPNGLLFMKARYYNPYLCRFLNPDPSGFAGGLNFYAYGNGNPVSYLDPSGFSAAATGDTSFTWLSGSSDTPANLNNPFGLSSADQVPSDFLPDAGGITDESADLFGMIPLVRGVSALADSGIGIIERLFTTESDTSLTANPNILSGHGGLLVGDSSPVTFVPEGTSVTFWTMPGKAISDSLGNAIETGNPISAEAFGEQVNGAATYLPGSVIPDYTLFPPNGLNILGNPTTVMSPTSLSTLLRSGMGNVNWSACQSIISQ